MREALHCLDAFLDRPVHLIVGGGGAMILAHHFSLSTSDIDALPAAGVTVDELQPFIKKVADQLSLPLDWLNPYYSSFTHVLPSDYGSRLVTIDKFRNLKVDALSKDDLLIMKCFAARQKDVVHARALVRQGADVAMVKRHIQKIKERKIPGTDRALNFLGEIELFFSEREGE